MSRIDERLEIMGVDTSEMTTEEKFTAATGLTRYDEEMAANDWYVPAGAANTLDEVQESEETGEQGSGSGSGSDNEEPINEDQTVEPIGSGSGTDNEEPTSEETGQSEETGEPSTAEVETGDHPK